jgi:uncharacterized protein (DUF2141 family)
MKSLLLLLLLVILTSASEISNFSLTIHITGFPSNEGKAYVGIYRPQDKWPEINKQFIGKVVDIENGVAKITFETLDKGSYAIAVFHDRNRNGILDKNMLGVPVEKYGFSNNARETFSAPSFQSAAVNLDKSKWISINVK